MCDKDNADAGGDPSSESGLEVPLLQPERGLLLAHRESISERFEKGLQNLYSLLSCNA